MSSSSNISHVQRIAEPTCTLQIDFAWKKFQSLITTKDDLRSDPIYIVDYKTLKPHLIFKSAAEDKPFATGSLHTFTINADCEIHQQPVSIQPLKRFKTKYTHRSHAITREDGSPMDMTWTANCGLKWWDFICLDEFLEPVAKLSLNVWALKKLGTIELMGPRSNSCLARDELVVTAFTLCYCMILRCNNILSFFGAIFAHPVDVKQLNPESQALEEVDQSDSDDSLKKPPKDSNIMEERVKEFRWLKVVSSVRLRRCLPCKDNTIRSDLIP